MDYIKEPSRTIDQGDILNEENIREIVEFYETKLKDRIGGPQLEGFEGSQLAEALRIEPENVFLVDILDKQGEIAKQWPLLVPTTYHQDYSQRFFAEHYPKRASYYVSLPPYEEIESIISDSENFEGVAQFLKEKNAIVTYDYREGDDSKELTPAFIRRLLVNSNASVEDITPESRAWGMDYGPPLALHYEGIARLIQPKDEPVSTIAEAVTRLITSGEAKYLPENGVTLLGKQEFEADDGKLLEQLWTIYSEHFEELVEDHPVLGKQPRQEFEAMLLDEDTVTTAFMVDGKVAGLLYMVHDIEKCVWLSKDYYDKEFESETGWMTHIPGIVVAKDKARQGAGYAQQMMNLTLSAVAVMNKDMIITFACSNVSSMYIPKMVRKAVRDSLYYEDEANLHVSAEYGYRILEIS
jgi:hypothetical protein